jgi:nucleotide-binding universal stress UspA family protein
LRGESFATASFDVKTVERILVPLDHSLGSDEIVEYACAVARGLGASITLLHAYEPPNGMVGIVAGATIRGEAQLEREAGMALLNRAAAILRANGLASDDRSLERSGPAEQVIARHARSGKFDLIVMGTHARTGVSRIILGSVADHVMRDVSCPVLLVHLPR